MRKQKWQHILLEDHLVDTHLYVVENPAQLSISTHLEELQHRFALSYKHPSKVIKVVYLINTTDIQLLYQIQQFIANRNAEAVKQLSVGLVPTQDPTQYVEMLHKVGGKQFEHKYLQVMDAMGKAIHQQIVESFCRQQFQWDEHRIQMFMKKEGVDDIQKLLSYHSYTPYEGMKVKLAVMLVNQLLDGQGNHQSTSHSISKEQKM